uniref:Uncharacterized protein n=1 Tax=Meloidogyne hapla TaxID=6305 RepID=A0A1I8B6H5_MELHA
MDNNNLLLKRRQAFSTESTNGSSSIDQFRTISDNDADIDEEMEINTLTGEGVDDSRVTSFSIRSSPTVLHFPSNRQRKELQASREIPVRRPPVSVPPPKPPHSIPSIGDRRRADSSFSSAFSIFPASPAHT